MANRLFKIITKEEFEKILKAVSTTKVVKQKYKNQFRVAIILGFEAGLRISEIVGHKDTVPPLQLENVAENYLRIVSGKGGKDRIVPRPRRLNQSSLRYIPVKIPRRSLQRWITKMGREVLKKEITFHTLRHGFVTNCINRGMALHEVQMFAGHSRLDTTGIYLHANPEQALKKYEEVF